jgi:divalent metal cation (Fe/Co/Zn/Cd) transporter
MATYISLQLLAAILTGTTSVMADSAQGMIDVATYGVSIYSQYKIDKSGDSLYQRKTGIWSAYFGAGSLFAMSFFFLAYTGVHQSLFILYISLP